MTRSQLIQKLASLCQIDPQKAEVVVDSIIHRLTEALIKNDRVEVRGFGTFEIRSYQARKGRNPYSGRAIRIGPKKLPHFRMGKELQEELLSAYRLHKGDHE